MSAMQDKLGVVPNFKFLFDLWLINQPGVQDLTFRTFHSYVFIEMLPDSKLTFSMSFNLGATSNYYELDYQVTPKLKVFGGKILIPFDDSSPHTLYGGRPNLSVLLPDQTQPFLPDLWAEVGVGAKYVFVDTSKFHLDGILYVTNGFQSQGTDPTGDGGSYPNFAGDSSVGTKDNNRDKAFGGRLESLWYRKFGLNASYYTCRWSDQSDLSERLRAYGIDAQLRFSATGTQFRSGLITMNVNVPGASFTRGGYYNEFSQKLGEKREWKAMIRQGYRQNDSRVIEINDQKLMGGDLIWKPGLIQWGLEYSHDFDTVPNKPNYNLAALIATLEM